MSAERKAATTRPRRNEDVERRQPAAEGPRNAGSQPSLRDSRDGSGVAKIQRKAAADAAAVGDSPGRLLLLLRHGIAEDRRDDLPDAERRLTLEGIRKMKQISRGLATIVERPDLILSSPLVRCVQTALRVAKAYDSKVEVRTANQLAPDATSKDFLELTGALSCEKLICVGHEPNLSEIMRALTGCRGDSELRKGGLYAVRITRSGGTLEWMLPPRVLRRLS
jgi:phosphohistidine phosphatase